jgi:NTP pyrophosphatase (non-canonical NTP hydrolase)
VTKIETANGGTANRDFPATLSELQSEARAVETERGTDQESVTQKALILAEESFELLKVLRYQAGVATDLTALRNGLDNELVDLLFVTSAIANRRTIELAEAIYGPAETRVICWEPCAEVTDSAGSVEVTDSAGSTALDQALMLAEYVLTIVTLSRNWSLEKPFSDDEHEASKEFENSLAQIVVLVKNIADRCRIDLRRAIDRKLRRDQQRLWSVAQTR